MFDPEYDCYAVADPGGGGARGARAPPSKKIIKNEDIFFYNGVVKNVICQYLYTI